MAKKQTPTELPNNHLKELIGIDYKNLTGEAFTKYHGIESSLFLREKYDFDVMKASSIEKKRFNEDTGKVEPYVSGIRILSETPIMRTRVKAGDAIEMNKQVSANAFDHGNSKYYLLVKPVDVKESEAIDA